jgi:hypothetical protein
MCLLSVATPAAVRTPKRFKAGQHANGFVEIIRPRRKLGILLPLLLSPTLSTLIRRFTTEQAGVPQLHMLQHARLTLGLAYELAFANFD